MQRPQKIKPLLRSFYSYEGTCDEKLLNISGSFFICAKSFLHLLKKFGKIRRSIRIRSVYRIDTPYRDRIISHIVQKVKKNHGNLVDKKKDIML